MKKSRYTPEQGTFGLRQAEEGTPVAEVCRRWASASRPSTAGSLALEEEVPRNGGGRGEKAAGP